MLAARYRTPRFMHHRFTLAGSVCFLLHFARGGTGPAGLALVADNDRSWPPSAPVTYCGAAGRPPRRRLLAEEHLVQLLRGRRVEIGQAP